MDQLSSAEESFAPNPQFTGKDGGRTLNLHQFARDRVTLLGHLQDANGLHLSVAGDLMDNLAASDKPAMEIRKGIDRFIQTTGMDAPVDNVPALRAGYESEVITDLDLNEADITSIVWATGYRVDFSWLQFSIFDEYGYPVQQRGVTMQPGLYFVGLPWLYKRKSSLFLGLADDVEYIAAHIAHRG